MLIQEYRVKASINAKWKIASTEFIIYLKTVDFHNNVGDRRYQIIALNSNYIVKRK